MKYNDLNETDIQRLVIAGILNGCGPSTWRGRAPQWLFRACCLQHDWNYAVGGTEADRRWADWGFYAAMVKDTKRLVWYKQLGARMVAWIFYRLVRWKGKAHFKHREVKVNMTVDQLIKEQNESI